MSMEVKGYNPQNSLVTEMSASQLRRSGCSEHNTSHVCKLDFL